MKILRFLLPFVGKILCDEQENQAENASEEAKMAEKFADTFEEIPKEKPNFRNLNETRQKVGKIDWENVYFEDTLDILGSKKTRFQILNLFE